MNANRTYTVTEALLTASDWPTLSSHPQAYLAWPATPTRTNAALTDLDAFSRLDAPRVVSRPGPVRRLAIAFLGLSLYCNCFGVRGDTAGLTPYVMQGTPGNPIDPTKADKAPPGGAGGGWSEVPAEGITLQPDEVVVLATLNTFQGDKTKTWKIMLGKKGDDAQSKSLKANLKKENATGFNPDGDRIRPLRPQEFTIPRNTVQYDFEPQPEWERIDLRNSGTTPITFTIEVEVTSKCEAVTVQNNTYKSRCEFCATGPGVLRTNMLITQIFMFPQTIALDPSVPPTISAPTNTGNWFAVPVYDDPDGTNRPLGGVLFSTDGLGLSAGEECQFSFTMQGPAADMQYTMYAYDDVSQEFQDFAVNLQPTLAISVSNNSAGLQFDTVLGLNYILESSPDLTTWQPLQTFTGTGGLINSLTPLTGDSGFFRLHTVPAPVNLNPLALSTVTAVSPSNFLVLSFSEPVDPLTALNPANYFLGNNFGPIPVVNVSQLWSRAVKLTLPTPLTPNGNYFLGVDGVTDLNGNTNAPTTVPVAAFVPQIPCPGGVLLVQQAYSECNSDGFWHVVEDDWYRCPDGTTQKFRVSDTKTTQPCGNGQAAPSAAGLLYPMAADVATTCQSPVYKGQVLIRECVGGVWSVSTYLKYACLDGSIYLSGPVQNVPINPITPCNQPPPPMPAP